MEHTPTPWTMDKRVVKWHVNIRGKSKSVIASVFAARTKGTINAEFICLACNAHDQLVKALENSYAELKVASIILFNVGTKGDYRAAKAAAKIARKALAAAKEK